MARARRGRVVPTTSCWNMEEGAWAAHVCGAHCEVKEEHDDRVLKAPRNAVVNGRPLVNGRPVWNGRKSRRKKKIEE